MSDQNSSDLNSTEIKNVIGACPLDCPDGCSWVVTVENGTATKLRGNPDHPFTQGGLCKKVNPWLTYAEDPSRLLSPLRRTGPKGSGEFEEITWEEALAEIAERLTDVKDRLGGEAIWPFAGTGNVGWLHGASSFGSTRLWNALGASGHSVSICSISGHVGLSYTSAIAATYDIEAIAGAGVVLLWGSNPLVTNQHTWPFIEGAREAGAEIVVIDPVRTRTAERADHHLAPLPGTDGALAFGLCRAILDAGGADLGYLASHTSGWDEFRAELETWTVARAAAECGIDETTISELGRLIADRAPLAIKMGQGMQRHAHGGQTARIVSCLPAITGAYGHESGGLSYSTGSQYMLNSVAGQRPDLRPDGHGRVLAMTNLGHNLVELNDPPVQALIVCGANPMVSNPETDLVRQGLSRDDLFTVVIDVFATETVDYADIVLPSTMQHEQNELNDSFAHLYVNWNEQAVEPPGLCLPHTEILRRLARALELTEPALYATDDELAEALLDQPSFREAGITLDTLRRDGFARLPQARGGFRPVADRFPTASGTFEFVSERAEREHHGRLPNYRPPAETHAPAVGHYVLVANGSDHHVNSVFAGTERVRSVASAPPVIIHADDALRDGLIDGDQVEVRNERGSFKAVLRIGSAARPGVASMTKGWWGQGVNATVIERDSDMGRGAVFHDNRVEIVAAS